MTRLIGLIRLDRVGRVDRVDRVASTPSGRAASPTLAITGVTLIDGTDGPARAGMTVIVREGRIAAVAADAAARVPNDADAGGRRGPIPDPGAHRRARAPDDAAGGRGAAGGAAAVAGRPRRAGGARHGRRPGSASTRCARPSRPARWPALPSSRRGRSSTARRTRRRRCRRWPPRPRPRGRACAGRPTRGLHQGAGRADAGALACRHRRAARAARLPVAGHVPEAMSAFDVVDGRAAERRARVAGAAG